MSQTTNIMIVGVGGQGTLLASKLLGEVLIQKGYDIKVSEVHGMSQRGGSVVTYVRYGEKVSSPVVETGEADMILAFELLEAARYLPYLKRGGTLIANTGHIDPSPVIMGKAEYPENLEEKLAANDINFIGVDAVKTATEAGSPKAVNVVLLGVLARQMNFSQQDWKDAIVSTVPAKFLDMNLKAFDLSGSCCG